MTISSILACSFLAAISLAGVSGGKIVARSGLDAHNVFVGDPIELTVDFIGEADFTSLHPPALSEAVDRAVWKIDDKSARTETVRGARRLVYRIRPMKEGLLEFPALEFAYSNANSKAEAVVSTTPMPVRAKKGAEVSLAEFDDVSSSLPMPDGLVFDLTKSEWGSGRGLTDDMLFKWGRACSLATAEAFGEFDFPEARLNEAACELMEGNWAKALKIYSALEWRIGQTAAIERGMVAALALKLGDGDVELPMWRRVLRPVLSYAWKGRALVLLGAVAAIAALLFLFRVVLKALVVLFLAFAPCSVLALDPFEAMERQMQEMQKRMNAMSKGSSLFTINGSSPQALEITAKATVTNASVRVGEDFDVVFEVETPKDCTLGNLGIAASNKFALEMLVDKAVNLEDAKSSNPSNVVKRFVLPIRYHAPFTGNIRFTVQGMAERAIRRGNFSSSFATSFAVNTGPVAVAVKPLEGVDVPEDFKGIVGSMFSLSQSCSPVEVETNDVVVVTAVLRHNGYVPDDALDNVVGADAGAIAFRRYFVADGRPATDDISVPYYDVMSKTFKRATAKGKALHYVSGKDASAGEVVVNPKAASEKSGMLKVMFAPREGARVVGLAKRSPDLRITEEHRGWVRIDDGKCAGWVRGEDLK